MKSQPKPIWTLSQKLSDSENQVYIHSFPILKDKITGKIILIGEFIYNKTEGTVFTNVANANDGTTYAPFYDRQYGDFSGIMSAIHNIIRKEMKKVGLQPCQ